VLQAGQQHGMCSFAQSEAQLRAQGRLADEQARDPEAFPHFKEKN
jgi:Tfp pilus assembly pilus retraction ATPase PilT